MEWGVCALLQISTIFPLVTSTDELDMFFFFFGCFAFLLVLCCEDASIAGIFSPFFFCLSAVWCAVSHTFLHSQPGPGSWHGVWFQKEVLSTCCSCERCLGEMLLFTQRFHEEILVCSAARSMAETALHHIAVQVLGNCCFGCKKGAWLTAAFLTTCLHYFSKIYIEV